MIFSFDLKNSKILLFSRVERYKTTDSAECYTGILQEACVSLSLFNPYAVFSVGHYLPREQIQNNVKPFLLFFRTVLMFLFFFSAAKRLHTHTHTRTVYPPENKDSIRVRPGGTKIIAH